MGWVELTHVTHYKLLGKTIPYMNHGQPFFFFFFFNQAKGVVTYGECAHVRGNRLPTHVGRKLTQMKRG